MIQSCAPHTSPNSFKVCKLPKRRLSASIAPRTRPGVIYWYRTDLRLRNSPALTAALDLSPEAFYRTWTWDLHYVFHARVSPNQWQFLYANLSPTSTIACYEGSVDIAPERTTNVIFQHPLRSSIPSRNYILAAKRPQTVLSKLFKLWKTTHFIFEKDTHAYTRDRDAEVIKFAKEAGVEVIIRMERTLYDL